MNIFGERALSTEIERTTTALGEEVRSEPENSLLNVNEEEYVSYLVDKYSIQPLTFQWDQKYITDREVQIRAEDLPRTFYGHPGETYARQVITYHIPFNGDARLLNFFATTGLHWTMDVQVSDQCISFDVISYNDDPEHIKREAEILENNVRAQNEHVTRDVANYNAQLPTSAKAAVQLRKQHHLKRLNLLEGLGVPLKKSAHTPKTFVIPTVRRKVVVKPAAPDAAFAPEPTLDATLYKDILTICRDTGVEMERHPSIYANKDEETLRDHFIMVLSPHFDSVTGETFNKTGKTDIMIRHESSIVFVAECKVWAGAKVFLRTIDQTLRYLTWRDSRAAIVFFVRNKELGPVLDQIEPQAEAHSCHVSTAAQSGEGWFNFSFHLLDDPTRGVNLAVLCFHLPPL